MTFACFVYFVEIKELIEFEYNQECRKTKHDKTLDTGHKTYQSVRHYMPQHLRPPLALAAFACRGRRGEEGASDSGISGQERAGGPMVSAGWRRIGGGRTSLPPMRARQRGHL